MRDRISRPRWSVPSKKTPPCANLVPGGAKGSSMAFGGKGASHGTHSATRTQKRRMPSPIRPTQLRRSWARVLRRANTPGTLTLTLSRRERGQGTLGSCGGLIHRVGIRMHHHPIHLPGTCDGNLPGGDVCSHQRRRALPDWGAAAAAWGLDTHHITWLELQG